MALPIVKVDGYQLFVSALSSTGITTFGRKNHTAGYVNTGLTAVHSRAARGHNRAIKNQEDAMNTIKKLNEILKTDGKLRLILSGMAVDGMLLLAVVIVLGAAMAA